MDESVRSRSLIEKVKAEMVSLGYGDSDFDEGGPFYGWSVNELIDFVRDKRRASDGD